MEIFNFRYSMSPQENQEINAVSASSYRGKKGKLRKSWQLPNKTIWQGQKRHK